MAQVIWNNTVIAESEDYIRQADAYYFPIQSINCEYFTPSNAKTTCFWKGEALYYHLEVNGQQSRNAAWYYPDPNPIAENIKDKIAFWKDIKIII